MACDVKMRSLAVIAAAIIAAIYLFGLGDHGLIEPDEGRYAEIAREMLDSGDFITPRLNFVRYFEKPPMLYWMDAASISLFGENELAARLPSAICALLCAAAAGAAGGAMFGRRAGCFSGVVCATSLLHFGVGRIDITDMPLTFFMTCALSSAYMASASEGRRYIAWICAFYAACALAVLTKGLIGIVLPGGAALLFSIIACRRNLRPRSLAAHIPGVAIFLLICAPWFIAVCRANSDFFRFFFIQEHLLRYTTTMHDRYEPFWYFVPILPAALLPWTGMLRLPSGGLRRQENVFLIVWTTLIFLFFSFSSSKLIPYIAPCVPPLAIMIGAGLARYFDGAPIPRRELALTAAIGLVLAGGLVWYSIYGSKMPEGTSPLLAWRLALPLAAGPIGAIVFTRRRESARAVVCLCLCAMLFYSQTGGLFEIIGATRSMRETSFALEAAIGDADITVASCDEILQGVPFYTHRRVMVAGSPGELEFGSGDPGADEWFLSKERFWDEWRAGRPFALVVRTDRASGIVPDDAAVARVVVAGRCSIVFSGGAVAWRPGSGSE